MKTNKIFALVLALVMIMSTVSMVVSAEDAVQSGTWGGIDWTLDADGLLTIKPTAGEPVPDKNAPTKRTYAVGEWRERVVYKSNGSASAIGGEPYDMKAVKKLVILEGVTKIGSFTCQFPNLSGDVVIPSTVTYIGQEAFQKAPLTKLTFAAGGTAPLCIANGAFKQTRMEDLAFPADREYIHIHHWAFGNCSNLKTVYLPTNITKLWGGEHVDYFDNFNSQSNVTWANYSMLFTGVSTLETVTFENEAIRDLFFAHDNGVDSYKNGAYNGDYIEAYSGLVAYNTLENALANASEGDTIVIRNKNSLKNDSGRVFNVPADVRNITINTAGNTLTGTIKLNNPATDLTIDGTFKGEVVASEDYSIVETEENGVKKYTQVLDDTVSPSAKIGNLTFKTVQKALDTAVAGETITLLKDVKENLVIPAAVIATFATNNGIVIDLNGKTLSPADENAPVLTNGASYVITNGTIEGDIVNEGSSLVLEDVVVKDDIIINEGSVDITSGTYEGAINVSDKADLTVSGGQFAQVVDAKYIAEDYDIVRTAYGYTVSPKELQADTISIAYELADEDEGEKTYAIVLKANNGDVINELASADLTFVYTTEPVKGGAITFEVAPAKDFAMTRFEDTNRYMFNYNGTTATEGTANEIVIGTITVKGYGKFTIATKAFGATEEDTNVVNATTVNDNLVDSYTVKGTNVSGETTGILDISGSVSDTIAVPVRTLTVNVAFPNNIIDNEADYQDMEVTISGGDLDKAYTIELGKDIAETNLDIENKAGAKYDVEFENNAYKVIITNALRANTSYVVTVSGEGYRTSRYTVTMTDNKTLNFWNNVMDEAAYIEEGKGTPSKVNYLAGDIVADNNINIFDLSAVVSYFGEIDLKDTPDKYGYVKYDLNRDGKIDSKDVALVLVSWNN